MIHRRALVFTALLLMTLTACRRPAPLGEEAAALAEGWNRLTPGGETTCSDGSEYAFFVRRGDPEKLLIHFEGGGACWTGETCDLRARPTYDPTVDETDNPAHRSGIFDLENPENPFAGYSMVFVPYCTADVHLGDRVTTYEVAATDSTEAHTVTIRHKGAVNARAVLDWTFANFRTPAAIFVTGSSAGAIPSPYYASIVADHYPEARTAQLGDAAGGYRRNDAARRIDDQWGIVEVVSQTPGFTHITPDDFSYEALYVAAARRHPEVRFARYDTADDEVQRFFLGLTGETDASLVSLIRANQADIDREVDNVRAYLAAGDVHTILSRPEFYTYEVNGRRFRDWIADLATGEAVADALCDECGVPAGPAFESATE